MTLSPFPCVPTLSAEWVLGRAGVLAGRGVSSRLVGCTRRPTAVPLDTLLNRFTEDASFVSALGR